MQNHRLLTPLESSGRTIGRTEDVQIQVTGVPVGKKICLLGLQGAQETQQQEDKQNLTHNLESVLK